MFQTNARYECVSWCADPSRSAFQLARKRLASVRASQQSGGEEEEEEDVELYPGVQQLITGTLNCAKKVAGEPGDFTAELSKSKSISR